MAEQERKNAGLQKKVSSVFNGVPIPQNNSAQQSSGTPAPENTANTSPKLVSQESQSTQSSLIKKLQQSEESLEKTTPAKQPPKQPEGGQFVGEKTAPAKKPEGGQFVGKKTAPAIQPEGGQFVGENAAPVKQPESQTFVEVASPGLLQKIKDKLFEPKPGVSSTRQKAMVVLVPILAIVMIFVLRQVLSTAPRKTEGATKNDPPVVVAAADFDNEIDWKIPEPLPAVMRDPIKLPDESNVQNGEQDGTTNENETETGIISVKAIVYSVDKPSAVINGCIVHIGDKVSDASVINISQDGVEFERDGEKWVQKVHE
jgi:hypothetical protein